MLTNIPPFVSWQTCSKLPRDIPIKDYHVSPLEKIDLYLSEIAVGDHLLSLQSLYRDTFDDFYLAAPLRSINMIDGKRIQLPRRELLSKLIEGRYRSLPLLKLTYGENSLNYLRGLLDLSSIYIQQNVWEESYSLSSKVLETLKIKFENNIELEKISIKTRLVTVAAERIILLFSILREEAINNCGFVTKNIISVLLDRFQNIPSHPEFEAILGPPARLVASLRDFLLLVPFVNETDSNAKKTKSKLPLRQAFQIQDRLENNLSTESINCRSWGEVIWYLRTKCSTYKQWVSVLHDEIFPQHRATLAIPFRLSCFTPDPTVPLNKVSSLSETNKGIYGSGLALGSLLISIFPECPSALRLLGGSDFLKNIQKSIQNQVQEQERVYYNFLNNQDQSGNNYIPPFQFFEIPIAQEEYDALIFTNCNLNTLNQKSHLYIQALIIKGLSCVFLNKADKSEALLTQALKEIESKGLDNDLSACELYNSIAQMMITRYENMVKEKKETFKKDAMTWIETEDGKRAIQHQLKLSEKSDNVKTYNDDDNEKKKSSKSKTSREENAEKMIIKKFIKSKFESSNIAKDQQNLKAAYRYLIKSLEIMEAKFGDNHISIGASCFAIASVQNMLKDYRNSREWLLRAIRILEKQLLPLHQMQLYHYIQQQQLYFQSQNINSLTNKKFAKYEELNNKYLSCFNQSYYSNRCVEFARVQLSKVLIKLNHENEAKRLLTISLDFHFSQIRRILSHRYDENQILLSYLSSYHSKPKISSQVSFRLEFLDKNILSQFQFYYMSSPKLFQSSNSSVSSTTPTSPNKPSDSEHDTSLYFVGSTLTIPPDENSALNEEVKVISTIINQLLSLYQNSGDEWEGYIKLEEYVKIIEEVYGWDAIETGDAYKLISIQCIKINDWIKASKYLQFCLNSYEANYSKSDPKLNYIIKLYQNSLKMKKDQIQNIQNFDAFDET